MGPTDINTFRQLVWCGREKMQLYLDMSSKLGFGESHYVILAKVLSLNDLVSSSLNQE